MNEKLKRAAFYLGAVLFSVLLAALLLEGLCTAIVTYQDGKFVWAKTRFADASTFVETLTQAGRSDCRYIDSLFPHPYLGFVHHANQPCGYSHINNIGLFGPDYPSERIPNRFVVLLTGGSVAAQVGQIFPGGPRYLEEALNRNYASPNGQPFLLLNGGDGAWKQPQALILFLLYADVVNAVVTLDGFNEHYVFGSGQRFEIPASNFLEANPVAASDFGSLVQEWMVGKAYGVVRRNPVLSRSHAAYFILRSLRKRKTENAPDTRRTTINTIFSLPPGWDVDRQFEWALRQYSKYILAMDAVAASRSVLSAHFIQPVPAIGKTLTEQEKAVVGDLGYRIVYQRITDGLMKLRDRGVQMHSLLDVFQNSQETLYADPIHLHQPLPGGSTGYRLMAERMVAYLAEDWKLQKRNRP